MRLCMRDAAASHDMPADKILIVEDEAPIREMIAFHLTRAGYDTVEAEDCRQARENCSPMSDRTWR